MYSAYRTLSRTERIIIESKKRRNRELQRRISIFILAVLLILTLTVLFFGTKSHAESSVIKEKCYVSVQVRGSETLSDIASEYYSEEFRSIDNMVSEIMHINNMQSDRITSGLYIVVPCYRIR